jgi:hypothetical protein
MHSVTCKFFNSPRGCRRGGECPYIHRSMHPGGEPKLHGPPFNTSPPWLAVDASRGTVAAEGKGRRNELEHLVHDRPAILLPSCDPQCKHQLQQKKRAARLTERWVARKAVPSLPNEMWDKIWAHCDPSSLAAVCGVCKSMRRSALPHRTAFRIDAAKLDQGTSGLPFLILDI